MCLAASSLLLTIIKLFGMTPNCYHMKISVWHVQGLPVRSSKRRWSRSTHGARICWSLKEDPLLFIFWLFVLLLEFLDRHVYFEVLLAWGRDNKGNVFWTPGWSCKFQLELRFSAFFCCWKTSFKKSIPRKRLLDPCGWQPWKYGSHLGLWQVSRKVPAETKAWHVLFVASLRRKPAVWCLELIRIDEFHSEVTFLFQGVMSKKCASIYVMFAAFFW